MPFTDLCLKGMYIDVLLKVKRLDSKKIYLMTKTLLPICPTTVSFTVYPRLNAKGLLLISALIWGTPIGVGRLLPWGAFSRERLIANFKKST